MQEKEYTLVENHKNCEITILCPGLSEKDVKINANVKENTLAISGELPKDSEDFKDVETSLKESISVPKTYGVGDATKKVDCGVLVITIPTSKDIKEI